MIHYLILVHNNFNQLEMLVNKIKTKNSKVYIHIDKKVKDFPEFKDICYIKDRQDISWGGTKMVEAELIGLCNIERDMENGDHIVIISGQCFPIKSVDYIENYIKDLGDKSCLSFGKASDEIIKARISGYRFYDINFHVPCCINNYLIKMLSYFKKFDTTIKLPVVNAIVSELLTFLLPRRSFLTDNYEIYYGSQWMVLSKRHVSIIKKFLESNMGKKYKNSFKYTAISDELFFQTLCLNLLKKNELLNNSLWFIKWENGKASPNYLTIKDLDDIKKSDKLFARKFDINKDKKILDVLFNL